MWCIPMVLTQPYVDVDGCCPQHAVQTRTHPTSILRTRSAFHPTRDPTHAPWFAASGSRVDAGTREFPQARPVGQMERAATDPRALVVGRWCPIHVPGEHDPQNPRQHKAPSFSMLSSLSRWEGEGGSRYRRGLAARAAFSGGLAGPASPREDEGACGASRLS